MSPAADVAHRAVVKGFSTVTQRAACHRPHWITNASWSAHELPGGPTLPVWDEVIWLQTKQREKPLNWIQRDMAEWGILDLNKLRSFSFGDRILSPPCRADTHPFHNFFLNVANKEFLLNYYSLNTLIQLHNAVPERNNGLVPLMVSLSTEKQHDTRKCVLYLVTPALTFLVTNVISDHTTDSHLKKNTDSLSA